MFIRSLCFSILMVFIAPLLRADVTIPVTSGNTPTCLGRLYKDVLIPSGWGTVSDTTAATRWAQSDQGTLGLTIFFEVRPNAGADYGANGLAVERTIGFTAINRKSTTGFISRNLKTFKAITKNMSSVWVHVDDGSGDLASQQKGQLPNILNEDPNSQNCNGFIYSALTGQNVSAKFGGGDDSGHPPANNFDVQTSATGSLWFNSTGNSPNSNAYFINSFATPRFPSGTYTWYFYGQTGVQHGTVWY